MQNLTVVTAAVAAAVMTFAIGRANGAPLSEWADQGFTTAPGKTAISKAGRGSKAIRTATAKVEKADAMKMRKPFTRRYRRHYRKSVDLTTTASIGPRH